MTDRPPFHLVATVSNLPGSESRAARRARLVAEIAALDREGLGDVFATGADFVELLQQVAASHHKPGVRDVARRAADELRDRLATLSAIEARQ